MLFNHNPAYSTLGTGARVKVLATGSDAGADRTQVLLSVQADQAAAITEALTALLRSRHAAAERSCAARPVQPANLRRSVLSAYACGQTDDATACVGPLVDATRGLSDAQRRAVADELGRIFAGADDVLVSVDLSDEYGGLHYTTWANAWLAEADDEEIADVADPDTDGGVLYEGLLAFLRGRDADIDELADNAWVDVQVDVDEVVAWARQNRPSALALLES